MNLMRCFLVILLILCFHALSAQTYSGHTFPGLDTVYARFTEQYGEQYPQYEEPEVVYLPVKDTCGWWIQPFTTRYNRWDKRDAQWTFFGVSDMQPKGPRVLFWDARAGEYQELNFPAQTPEFPEEVPGWLDTIAYDILPCYGYDSWAQDADRILSGKTAWEERDMAALAMAREERMLRHLKVDAQQPCVSAAPSAQRMDSLYLDWQRTDSAWAALYARSPGYRTPAGTIPVKRAHLRMDIYMRLRMAGLDEQARVWLNGVEYPASVAAYARNILNSCAPDAILFVNEDVEFYPVLWQQAVKGLRTDVSVLHAAWLRKACYRQYWRAHVTASQRIPVQIPDNRYPYVEQVDWKYSFDAQSLDTFIANWVQDTLVAVYSGLIYYKHPHQEDTLWITIHALSLPAAVLLDILETGGLQRPLCFTHAHVTPFTDPLKNWLVRTGMVAVFTPNAGWPYADDYDYRKCKAFYAGIDMRFYAPDRALVFKNDILIQNLYRIAEKYSRLEPETWRPVVKKYWAAVKPVGPFSLQDQILLIHTAALLGMDAEVQDMLNSLLVFLEDLKAGRTPAWKTPPPEPDFYSHWLPELEGLSRDAAVGMRIRALLAD